MENSISPQARIKLSGDRTPSPSWGYFAPAPIPQAMTAQTSSSTQSPPTIEWEKLPNDFVLPDNPECVSYLKQSLSLNT
ncbi:hypothetical protein [Sphaerothrix gracilis]|uniref:hypothetical protein n=1 Tax=Sphaerothrix gracilis TaxID=3151835 RepID=UPI0031FCEFB2